MHSKMKLERHERMYGPHFTEECALKAVSKMHNNVKNGKVRQLRQKTISENQINVNRY